MMSVKDSFHHQIKINIQKNQILQVNLQVPIDEKEGNKNYEDDW